METQAPDNPTAHLYLGHAFYSKKKFNAARKEYEEAIRLNPSISDAHRGLGMTYFQMGDNGLLATYSGEFRNYTTTLIVFGGHYVRSTLNYGRRF